MALVGIVYYYFFASFSKTDETQYVYIDDDDNADSVYHKLSDIATIHGLNAFTIMARHSGYADHVKTGRYAIKPGEGAFVVLASLFLRCVPSVDYQQNLLSILCSTVQRLQQHSPTRLHAKNMATTQQQ